MEPERALNRNFLGIRHIEVIAAPGKVNPEEFKNVANTKAVLVVKVLGRVVD